MYFKNGCPCSINWASHLLPFLVPHIAGAKSTAFLSSSDSIKVIIGLDVIYISTVSFFHDSPQMVQQADTTGSEHDMHVSITYVVLTHDCLSMWLVISFVLLISVYLLIWFSCSLVNFGKSNFLQFLISNWNLVTAIICYHFFYLTTSLSQSIFIVFGLYCHLCHDFASSWDNAAISSSFSSFHHKYYPLINIWQCAVFMLGWNGTRNKQWEEIGNLKANAGIFLLFFSGALHLIQDENMNVTC